MKCYQIFYNSAAETLDGSTGFGVTSVTEGTPMEYIRLIDSTAYLRSYSSGKFDFDDPSQEMSDNPEKVYEYPRRYLYTRIAQEGKELYVIERIVNTVYDHEFYSTGEQTRPGNFVAHALVFEEFPGKDIFKLLYEKPEAGSLRFLPVDWTPKKDNKELVELMVEQPRKLPMVAPVVKAQVPALRKESIDLFFSYLESSLKDKHIMISILEKDAAPTCAGMMSLLPESVAKKASFILNHQSKGYSMNVKMSFVNEYYPFPVYETVCDHMDVLRGRREVGNIEKIWRTSLEQAISAGDVQMQEKLAAWIYGEMAVQMQDKPVELNLALFEYCCNDSEFTLEQVDKVNEILSAISDAVSKGHTTQAKLVELLCAEFTSAEILDDYRTAMRLAQKVEAAGFDISEVIATSKKVFTAHLLASTSNLASAVSACDASLLRKYSDTAKLPGLKGAISSAVNGRVSVDYAVTLAAFLEESAAARVKTYVELLRENPTKVTEYSALLDSDRAEAQRVDYLTEFAAMRSESSFADFYYGQLMRALPVVEPAKSIKALYAMSECNKAFAAKLLSDVKVYKTLYDKVLADLTKDSFAEVAALVEKYVLSILPKETSIYRKWQVLKDVITVQLSAQTDVQEYYHLAVKLDVDQAIIKIAPKCFEVLPVADADEVVAIFKEKMALTDKQMLAAASTVKNLGKNGWLVSVARAYGYDYEQIADAAKAFGIRESDHLKSFMTEHFKKEYSAYKRKVFIGKIKSLFSKKEK